MWIKKIVDSLVSEHRTNDPFEICNKLEIIVIEEALGTINGYYNEMLGIKFIHVNEALTSEERKFVVAHELGHATLHPNFNYNFLKSHTLFNIDKYEKEANKFAFNLLSYDRSVDDGFSECSQTWRQVGISV